MINVPIRKKNTFSVIKNDFRENDYYIFMKTLFN